LSKGHRRLNLEPESLEEEFESEVLRLGGVVEVESLVLILEVSLEVFLHGVSRVSLTEEFSFLGLLLSGLSVLDLLLLGLLDLLGLGEGVELGDDGLNSELGVDGVSGWENVVDVDVLDERLALDSVSDSLLGDSLVDSSWSSVNSGNQTVWVLSSGGVALGHLQNDGLSSGISAGEENNDSSCSENLARRG